MSDQWTGGEAGERVPMGIVGGEVGEGLFANQAFAVDMVFRNAMAILKEQPALVIAGGFLMFIVQMLPSLVNLPFSFYFSFASASGEMDEQTSQLASTAISLVIQALFFPITQLVIAGYVVAAGRYVASGELAWGALVTSVGPAIRSLLYTILVTFISLAIAAIFVAPAAGLIYGWYVGSVPGIVAGLISTVLGLAWLVVVIYVGLGLQLGLYSAILDDGSPVDALRASWSAASGARLTLFVTNFVYGIVVLIASVMVYCLIGLVLLPVVQGLYFGGFAASWLLYARPDAVARKWGFFERNPAPYI